MIKDDTALPIEKCRIGYPIPRKYDRRMDRKYTQIDRES